MIISKVRFLKHQENYSQDTSTGLSLSLICYLLIVEFPCPKDPGDVSVRIDFVSIIGHHDDYRCSQQIIKSWRRRNVEGWLLAGLSQATCH